MLRINNFCIKLIRLKYTGNVHSLFPLQNTSGEIKFALRVENELNKIVYPEYRQLVVELLMVFHVFLERDSKLNLSGVVQLDTLVKNANQLFLDEQVYI